MLNTLSSLSAARSSGILDCTTYIAGVSGSCWAINTLMSIGGASLPWTLQHLRQRIKEPFLTPEAFVNLLDTDRESSVSLLTGAILKNASKGGEVSLVDVYGTLVSTRLFVSSESPAFPPPPNPISLETLKTSSQRRFIDDGQAPLPIYCTIRHDLPPDDVVKQKEQEGMTGQEILAEGKWHWFEITPYEVGCDQLGAFIPTWSLGRHFDAGKSVERVPELSLTILSGIFASAFTATLLNYWVELKPLLASLPFSGTINEFITSNAHKLDAIHPFPPAELPNFLKGLKGKLREGVPDAITDLETLGFMDAGANMNLPYVPLMRRQCDIVIALDASADSQDLWFTRAAEYAKAYTPSSPTEEGGVSRWPGVDAAALFPRRAEEGEEERAAEKVDEAKKQEGEVLDRAVDGEEKERERERRGVREKNPQPAPLGSAPTSAGGAAPGGGAKRGKEEEKELGLGAEAGDKPMPRSSAEGEPPLSRCSIWIGSTSPQASKTCRNDHPTLEDVVERDGIALAYIPLSAHPDEGTGRDGTETEKELPFDPLEVFSTWRFDYTEEETDRLVRLGQDNFMAGEEQLKTLIKGVWMRKRKQRREEEKELAGRQ
ncbi:SPOSA6832_04137, partial [Sporobolomyces salmonicolor]